MKTTNLSLRSFVITSILTGVLATMSFACGGDPNGAADPAGESLTDEANPAASASASPTTVTSHVDWAAPGVPRPATAPHGSVRPQLEK